MTDTPEDWVLIEAAKRIGREGASSQVILDRWYSDAPLRALCDMIAKHEQKPVDRKLLCAREAYRLWREDGFPAFGKDEANPVAIRAIELWEEGFGK